MTRPKRLFARHLYSSYPEANCVGAGCGQRSHHPAFDGWQYIRDVPGLPVGWYCPACHAAIAASSEREGPP